jgi:hypothetical protein
LQAAREAPRLRAVRADFDRRGLRQRADRHSRETDELRPATRTRRARPARTAGLQLLRHLRRARDRDRASNNYGPNQFPEKVIPLFITNAIDHRPSAALWRRLNVRDWLHVDDHCRAIDLLIDAGSTARCTTSAAATKFGTSI